MAKMQMIPIVNDCRSVLDRELDAVSDEVIEDDEEAGNIYMEVLTK